MNLLCHDYLDFKDVNQKFGIDAVTYFIDEIKQLGQMQADKLIDMDAAGIRILPKGRLLGRNVAMVFDEYLGKKHHHRFSKVIWYFVMPKKKPLNAGGFLFSAFNKLKNQVSRLRYSSVPAR